MAPTPKLSGQDVKRIRRRINGGAYLIDVAREFGVNRKTIRRRLDALERAETERARRLAAKRVARRAAEEKLKLLEREGDSSPAMSVEPTRRIERAVPQRKSDPYLEWLDAPKNVSGRARAEATGLVRVCNPDNTRRVWVERSEVEALLDDGWRLDE